MGCDIHIIVERKNSDGKWEYIEDVPNSFDKRNYATFAVFANVRNSFHIHGFEPKGLPTDLSARKFRFKSEYEHIQNLYNTGTERFVELPSGERISPYDGRIKKSVNSEEEARKYGGWSCCAGEYIVTDLSLVNGKYVNIPYKELFTFEKYKEEHWKDEWDEDAQDYGYWRVDFDCEDYHSHSWLTLSELKEYDTSDYSSCRSKISKKFYDKFIELGGTLPKEMQVLEDFVPSSIAECIQQAISPEVIISWKDDSMFENSDLHEGIKELEDIANKYSNEPDEIRIVFAFDN